jgi:hypothetical protein
VSWLLFALGCLDRNRDCAFLFALQNNADFDRYDDFLCTATMLHVLRATALALCGASWNAQVRFDLLIRALLLSPSRVQGANEKLFCNHALSSSADLLTIEPLEYVDRQA